MAAGKQQGDICPLFLSPPHPTVASLPSPSSFQCCSRCPVLGSGLWLGLHPAHGTRVGGSGGPGDEKTRLRKEATRCHFNQKKAEFNLRRGRMWQGVPRMLRLGREGRTPPSPACEVPFPKNWSPGEGKEPHIPGVPSLLGPGSPAEGSSGATPAPPAQAAVWGANSAAAPLTFFSGDSEFLLWPDRAGGGKGRFIFQFSHAGEC